MWGQHLELFLIKNHRGPKLYKMLIVDNDDLTIEVMRKIFRDDYELFICDSAEEYYAKYSNNNFDIILMDISLNGSKNGLYLIKEIKASSSYTGTPILCLTAHVQDQMRRTALESGSDLFLTKPVSIKVLKGAIESLLQSKILKK